MRYEADHKHKTRRRVLEEAAKAVRVEGAQGVGVAAVMAQAGLTHGAFYAHFDSRDDLITAAVDQMFEEGAQLVRSLAGRTPVEVLSNYIDFYVSPAHRDSRTAGCPLPFLSVDAPRLPAPARQAFARGLSDLTAMLAVTLARLGREDPEEDAASMLSELVGAVSLARAEPDEARSNLILSRTGASLRRRFDLDGAG